MLIRKSLAFLFTLIIAGPILGYCFMLMEGSSMHEVPGLILFTYYVGAPIILLFGVPISVLSDKLNDKFRGIKRILYTFMFHFSCGFLFVFTLMLIESKFILSNLYFDSFLVVSSSILAVTFWGMDEILRRFHRKNTFHLS